MKKSTIRNLLATALTIASFPATACGGETFLGSVCTVGFNFCPRGYAAADGQLLPINQNQALFALLGTQFGGDGRTTFALPDLRSRSVVGAGMGAAGGLTEIAIGAQGGTEFVALTSTTDSIPFTGRNKNTNTATVLTQVGPASLDVRSPYVGMLSCIALQGIFPSRNE
jgi:microcystin-dependent protein